MSKARKLLEAMMASEARTLVETTVQLEGDKVVIVKNDGSRDEFKPKDQTAQEVVDKFNSIFRHSEGRAWQWLRKVQREEPLPEGYKKIVDDKFMWSKDGESWEECTKEEYDECGYEEIILDKDEVSEGEDLKTLYVVRKTDNGDAGDYVEYKDISEEDFIDQLKADETVVGIYGSCTNAGPIDPKWIRESKKPVTEADASTECPYHNLLADLLNKENVTVEDYAAAIIKFNEAPDIPEDKKARIIEILNHIKDEELEHVKELQEADKILKGEDAPAEPVGEPVPDEPLPPAEPEEEVEVEYESIKEALLSEDEVFTLLKDKEFKDFDEVEALFKEKGYEVTDVYREGDGFNLNLRKDGVEYFIPFVSCKDKFCATLDNAANLDKPIEEGLGEYIAAKVARAKKPVTENTEDEEVKEVIEIMKKGGAKIEKIKELVKKFYPSYSGDIE